MGLRRFQVPVFSGQIDNAGASIVWDTYFNVRLVTLLCIILMIVIPFSWWVTANEVITGLEKNKPRRRRENTALQLFHLKTQPFKMLTMSSQSSIEKVCYVMNESFPQNMSRHWKVMVNKLLKTFPKC